MDVEVHYRGCGVRVGFNVFLIILLYVRSGEGFYSYPYSFGCGSCPPRCLGNLDDTLLIDNP